MKNYFNIFYSFECIISTKSSLTWNDNAALIIYIIPGVPDYSLFIILSSYTIILSLTNDTVPPPPWVGLNSFGYILFLIINIPLEPGPPKNLCGDKYIPCISYISIFTYGPTPA